MSNSLQLLCVQLLGMASCVCNLHGDGFPLLFDGLQLLDKSLLLLPELLQLLQQRVLILLLQLRQQLQTLPVKYIPQSSTPVNQIHLVFHL